MGKDKEETDIVFEEPVVEEKPKKLSKKEFLVDLRSIFIKTLAELPRCKIVMIAYLQASSDRISDEEYDKRSTTLKAMKPDSPITEIISLINTWTKDTELSAAVQSVLDIKLEPHYTVDLSNYNNEETIKIVHPCEMCVYLNSLNGITPYCMSKSIGKPGEC